jgi:hypothetical protein
MLQDAAGLDGRLTSSLDSAGLVGARFRDELVHEFKAKLVLREGRDLIELRGAPGSGRHTVARALHAAAADLLGHSGPQIELDCSTLTAPGELTERLARAATDAACGTLVLAGLDGLSPPDRAAVGAAVDADRDLLIVAIQDESSASTSRHRSATRIVLKPLHQREEDIWELVDHFFVAGAEDAGLLGCRGFSRQAKADIAESVRETGLASVRRLKEIVRDVLFDAATLASVPLKITSDHVRPSLESRWSQTAEGRAARDLALVESQFEHTFNPSLSERLATIHGVSPELLERQARILREVIDSIDDVPRSYRNIMDRADDVSRAALWLLTDAATQAEFRRFFGDARFMRPTKSVAWAFYNRAFKRDA